MRATYRGLFAVPGFPRVAAATVVARTGAAMQASPASAICCTTVSPVASPWLIGMPLGSAIAGPVVQHSIPIAFAVAVLADVIAGVAAVLMLRPSRTGRARRGGGSDGGNAEVQPGAAVAVGG